MNNGAASFRPIDDSDILLDTVIGLHLEAPPVCPECSTHAVFSQFIGDLVGLHAVVEGPDLISKLISHIHDGDHFIRTVAVHMDDDVALQDPCKGFQLQIAFWRFVQSCCKGCIALGFAGLCLTFCHLALIVVPILDVALCFYP